MTPVQLVGFLCWRAGLLLVASYSFFRMARLALQNIHLPPQLQVGFSLALAGAALVLASLIQERVADARNEEDLRE
jgi:hypothetical protein